MQLFIYHILKSYICSVIFCLKIINIRSKKTSAHMSQLSQALFVKVIYFPIQLMLKSLYPIEFEHI